MTTMVLGLTGSIATGKSTVSAFFRELNIPVIDADWVAREVTEPHSLGLQRIVAYFGEKVLNPDGTMNRGYLGKRVFGNPAELKVLTNITAPLIRVAIIDELAAYKVKQIPLVVLDMPLLYEQHYETVVDQVMVVCTTEEQQLNRLMQRNGLTQVAAQQRIDSQISIAKKIKLADVVIDNTGDVAETKRQVVKWLEEQSFRNEE